MSNSNTRTIEAMTEYAATIRAKKGYTPKPPQYAIGDVVQLRTVAGEAMKFKVKAVYVVNSVPFYDLGVISLHFRNEDGDGMDIQLDMSVVPEVFII